MSNLADNRRAFLQRRAQAYKSVFSGPDADIVLADLKDFCRAAASTFHPDPRLAAALDGRREVFLRIQEHVRLTDDELWNLKSGG